MLHGATKTHDFPNAWICRMPNGKYREQPKWSPCISVERSRAYVAAALRDLRRFRKAVAA